MVFVVVFAALALGEKISIQIAVGTAIVTIGTVLIALA